jgi:hypothetical protein
VKEWAEFADIKTTSIPGKLFTHEESPALSATILHEFFESLDRATPAFHQIL